MLPDLELTYEGVLLLGEGRDVPDLVAHLAPVNPHLARHLQSAQVTFGQYVQQHRLTRPTECEIRRVIRWPLTLKFDRRP